ncbi:hypothetical protein J2W56_001088 [Nocardia kruczakiae]|uniref:Uncharacterized protein n=1 Tax=Nocardia kruczakiae TaxID=261477 RepID=A0ABU1X9Y6_9NOCA|nr:hypothetical protein [Nocardia kruczakiae]
MREFPQAVAEGAAHIRLPLALTGVLVNDLIDHGYLIVRSPEYSGSPRADIVLLRAVLDGLRKL